MNRKYAATFIIFLIIGILVYVWWPRCPSVIDLRASSIEDLWQEISQKAGEVRGELRFRLTSSKSSQVFNLAKTHDFQLVQVEDADDGSEHYSPGQGTIIVKLRQIRSGNTISARSFNLEWHKDEDFLPTEGVVCICLEADTTIDELVFIIGALKSIGKYKISFLDCRKKGGLSPSGIPEMKGDSQKNHSAGEH